jgi:SAM-dependent methyltransferase
VDQDEYRRMAEAGEAHWWYRNTRELLRQLLADDLAAQRRRFGAAGAAGVLHFDAGGGTGATGGWLTDDAPTVLGDYETMALDVARTDFPGYLPVRMDLNHLPFAADAFATTLCVTALCHRMNPDPGAIVREFARITRPGGTVCLWEPGGKRLWRGHDEVTHTARRFSVRDLRRLAEAAGLDVVRATGAYTFLVPPAFLLGLLERGKAKSDVGRQQSGLGGVLGGLASIERTLLRRFDVPFGLSAIVVARRPAA